MGRWMDGWVGGWAGGWVGGRVGGAYLLGIAYEDTGGGTGLEGNEGGWFDGLRCFIYHHHGESGAV